MLVLLRFRKMIRRQSPSPVELTESCSSEGQTRGGRGGGGQHQSQTPPSPNLEESIFMNEMYSESPLEINQTAGSVRMGTVFWSLYPQSLAQNLAFSRHTHKHLRSNLTLNSRSAWKRWVHRSSPLSFLHRLHVLFSPITI